MALAYDVGHISTPTFSSITTQLFQSGITM
jgi:hypothetical protein